MSRIICQAVIVADDGHSTVFSQHYGNNSNLHIMAESQLLVGGTQ